MKYSVILVITFLILSFISKAQITIQNINLVVPCCLDTDSIDIGNNGVFDINVISNFAVDNENTESYAMQSNISLASPVIYGNTFPFYNYVALVAQTTMGCAWNSVWYPNTGFKYEGFSRINSPGDTTFGWIQLDFRGDAASCSDTVFGIQLAYSNISNVHLVAGQITTGIDEYNADHFKIFPNPLTSSSILQVNTQLNDAEVVIYDVVGKEMRRRNFSGDRMEIERGTLESGVYFVRVRDGGRQWVEKMVVE